jgi:hypothetical protein
MVGNLSSKRIIGSVNKFLIIELIKGYITKIEVDAIVNVANIPLLVPA